MYKQSERIYIIYFRLPEDGYFDLLRTYEVITNHRQRAQDQFWAFGPGQFRKDCQIKKIEKRPILELPSR